MKRYKAYLIRAMSQMVEFDAPDDATPEQLRELAEADHDLEPNISNRFDADGDVGVYSIQDAATDEYVYREGAE